MTMVDIVRLTGQPGKMPWRSCVERPGDSLCMLVASLVVEAVEESVNSEQCDLPIDQWRSVQPVRGQWRTTDEF